MGFVNKTSLFI